LDLRGTSLEHWHLFIIHHCIVTPAGNQHHTKRLPSGYKLAISPDDASSSHAAASAHLTAPRRSDDLLETAKTREMQPDNEPQQRSLDDVTSMSARVRTSDVSHSLIASLGLPLLAHSRSACQHVSLLDGTDSTFNNLEQPSANCVTSSPQIRGVLALNCDLQQQLFRSEIKCLLLCPSVHHSGREFQGPRASSIYRGLHKPRSFAGPLALWSRGPCLAHAALGSDTSRMLKTFRSASEPARRLRQYECSNVSMHFASTTMRFTNCWRKENSWIIETWSCKNGLTGKL
jgi:hypothetical protein